MKVGYVPFQIIVCSPQSGRPAHWATLRLAAATGYERNTALLLREVRSKLDQDAPDDVAHMLARKAVHQNLVAAVCVERCLRAPEVCVCVDDGKTYCRVWQESLSVDCCR